MTNTHPAQCGHALLANVYCSAEAKAPINGVPIDGADVQQTWDDWSL